jgi:hypothetical protein
MSAIQEVMTRLENSLQSSSSSQRLQMLRSVTASAGPTFKKARLAGFRFALYDFTVTLSRVATARWARTIRKRKAMMAPMPTQA